MMLQYRVSKLIRPSLVARQLAARHSRVLVNGSTVRPFFSSPIALQQIPDVDVPASGETATRINYQIPQRVRQKVVSAQDAVALVRDGDTVAISGFVTQGAAEAVLKALGERFDGTGSPSNLTIMFGGGPGDYATKGLNHLAKTSQDGVCMLRRTIGGHYGQVPMVADLALKNVVEAWAMPMGSISRMIRAQATHSPGHITTVGLGTYVDPDMAGGAINESATKSKLHKKLVSKVELQGQTNLMYKALPINVAIIRGTTADSQGNISLEHESLLCDQKITATAAKNSGGIVIAQVKRLAANGTIKSGDVAVPGPLVDCVVVVDHKDHDTLHPMSYVEAYNPALTGETITPQDEIAKMPLDIRKIIARRAFMNLKPDKIVNLGIGLPEGVASVAGEEDMLQYVTLSTEPGVFGGLPASGHNFGPAFNASSRIEMNQMFDFYNGGGLDMCFLGAAQIAKNGDINVSRMSLDRLTGPGGFIDISQSTRNVCFMSPFTAKGLTLDIPGDGSLKIKREGQVKKLVQSVLEVTFSGDEAVKRGQQVLYVTERAVFRRTYKYDVLELIEIAPGVDLQKDVLDQMEFMPAISPNLKTMDGRIFMKEKMKAVAEFFGSLEERCIYRADDHTLYLNLFGITLNDMDDINWFFQGLRGILGPFVKDKGPMDTVVNYDGFDLRGGLEEAYTEQAELLAGEMFKNVKRYTGQAFRRATLKTQLHMSAWDPDELFDKFDTNGDHVVSIEELRRGFLDSYQIHLTPNDISLFQNTPGEKFVEDRELFANAVRAVLELNYTK